MSFEPRNEKNLGCMWQHHSVWLSNIDLRAEERREPGMLMLVPGWECGSKWRGG